MTAQNTVKFVGDAEGEGLPVGRFPYDEDFKRRPLVWERVRSMCWWVVTAEVLFLGRVWQSHRAVDPGLGGVGSILPVLG